MNAVEVIRSVEAWGGSLHVENEQLRVRAPSPLPADLVAAITENKPAIMVALGAPIDTAIASVLAEIRPHLSEALQQLPDDRLLVLVNWNIITAWNAATSRVSGGMRRGSARSR